jgi:KTSC domain
MPSTAIGKIDYDQATRRLYIDFVANGRRYVYLDVPPDLFEAFRLSFSKGTFFNARIRPDHDCELIYDPNWGKSRKAG